MEIIFSSDKEVIEENRVREIANVFIKKTRGRRIRVLYICNYPG